MKKMKHEVTFVIEWDADNPATHKDIINRALHYLLGVEDGIASNELHDIPGSASAYHPHGPIRVLWHAETRHDWTGSTSKTAGFKVELVKEPS